MLPLVLIYSIAWIFSCCDCKHEFKTSSQTVISKSIKTSTADFGYNMKTSFHLKAVLALMTIAVGINTTIAQDFDISIQPVGILGETGGSGPYPAVARAFADMRENTVYMPATLPEKPMPLVIWGTGGCHDNGLGYAGFLREIASYGFIIISGGYPRFERELLSPEQLAERNYNNSPNPLAALEFTTVAQLKGAIDWARAVNEDAASPLQGNIDLDRIAAMGHSCGGLQAITLFADPHVDTVIAFNSGALNELPPQHLRHNKNLNVGKEILDDLHGPIAYINGGPGDIAYPNASDDLARIESVPVFFAENGVGHGGTFHFDANGGEYAKVATAWMQWQLNNDKDAANMFLGPDCGLCISEGWKVQRKGIE